MSDFEYGSSAVELGRGLAEVGAAVGAGVAVVGAGAFSLVAGIGAGIFGGAAQIGKAWSDDRRTRKQVQEWLHTVDGVEYQDWEAKQLAAANQLVNWDNQVQQAWNDDKRDAENLYPIPEPVKLLHPLAWTLLGLLVAMAITFFAGGISYDYYYDAEYLYFAPMLLFPLFALLAFAICCPVNKYRRIHRKHQVLTALNNRAQYLSVHQSWLTKDEPGKRDFTRYSGEPLSSLPSVDWVHNNQQLATHQKEVSNIIAQVKKGKFPDILELKFIEPVPVVPKFDNCIGGPNTKAAITQITLEDWK